LGIPFDSPPDENPLQIIGVKHMKNRGNKRKNTVFVLEKTLMRLID
jgi:hypothetical protein